MARYNPTLTQTIKSSIPERLNLTNNNQPQGSPKNVFFAVVSEIILDDKYPQGTILFTTTQTKTPGKASPLFSNSTIHPIAGEVVVIFSFTDTEYNKRGVTSPFIEDNPNVRNFYLSGVNIWDNPSFNGVASSSQITDSSNPSYFQPNNVRSLKSFVGDVILEGRFGNSIRFGGSYSDSVSNVSYQSSNPNSPITIINNSPISSFSSKYSLENPNNDSSIYLTSDQKVKFSAANENFKNCYNNPPLLPSEFSNPQIILNSDRIVLNAKKDSVLISSQKSIGLLSNNSINLECKQFYLNGLDIKLGSPSAEESALLGDKTVQTLRILIKELVNLTKALSEPSKTMEDFNLKMNPIASISYNNINQKVLNELETLKSNFIKLV